jgi:hypothetical protein
VGPELDLRIELHTSLIELHLCTGEIPNDRVAEGERLVHQIARIGSDAASASFCRTALELADRDGPSAARVFI